MTGTRCSLLPFFGIIVTVIGEWGCTMCRDGGGGGGGNQSEITKLKK